MVTKRRIAVITGLILSVVLLGAAKCGTKDSTWNDPSTKYAEPKGLPAEPPPHGKSRDSNDNDFFVAATPPRAAVAGTVTYEVRAQMYGSKGESVGGLATAFIEMEVLAGDAGKQNPGVFPYNKESVTLPFQHPIFIEPDVVVVAKATFSAFAVKGASLACWLVTPLGVEIPRTRVKMQAAGESGLVKVECYSEIGK